MASSEKKFLKEKLTESAEFSLLQLHLLAEGFEVTVTPGCNPALGHFFEVAGTVTARNVETGEPVTDEEWDEIVALSNGACESRGAGPFHGRGC